MALFPAFAGLSSGNSNNEKQSKELDWLNNQSFSTDDALSLHQRAVELAEPGSQTSEISFPAVQKQRHRKEDEEDLKAKKRKKKEKKKKEKKHKKRSRAASESSGCDSDTVYPSDLLKQATDPCRQEEEECVSGSFVWLDDLQTPTDRPFCIDRKADSANWEYKSLYRADIARYRRKGSSALGLNPKTQSVSWVEPGSEKKADRKTDRRPERYYSRGARQLLSSRGLPARPGLPGPEASIVPAHFIPVPPCTEQEGQAIPQGTSWVNPLGVYDPSTSLWLQGKGPAEHEKQQEAGPPGAGGAGSACSQLAVRVEHFNRRLRENPTDTPTWLEFVRFQDELTGGAGSFTGLEGEPDGRRKSLRMTLEKKVSILERALESNPTSVELKLARLTLCQELWEPATLLKEWKKLVFLHPNDAPLWRRYLLFTQSQFSTFTVSKVNAVYGKCLSTLASVQDGSMLSHPAQPGTEEAMLEIFLQQCHFLRQAGHSEKAVSLFQAMLDFTFFKPDSVRELPTRQQVEFFEPFWDSGEPRIGEKGARGWKAWMHQQERGGWLVPNDPEDDDDDEEDSSEVKDKSWPKWRIWLDVEASRESNHWLPWRPDKSKGQTEEDCEDPDRQVLFDDLGPSMIRLCSPELRFQLVGSFLQFLGLPGEGWYQGPSWSCLLDNTSLLEEGPDAERPLTSSLLRHTGVGPVGHMTPLGSARRQTGLCKEGEEFVQLVLQQVTPLCSSREKALLSLYWIQYEKLKVMKCVQSRNKKRLKSQGKRSKKLAKRLLKEEENRGNLALWREYAHLEWLLGNLEEGRKVFDTAMALGVARGLKDPELCRLCLLYAQLEAEEARGGASPCTSSAAVYVLTKLAEGGAYAPFSGLVPPVAVLKARKSYEQAVQAALDRKAGSTNAGKNARVAELVGCFALFQYLTTGVEAATSVFSQALERLEGSGAPEDGASSDSSAWGPPSELESLCVMRALLLQHHTSTSVYPLRQLRETLTTALSSFPTNPLLWQLYLRLEKRFHSAGRARRFFHTVTKSIQSVTPQLFAICAEQRRKELVNSAVRADCYGEVFSSMPENGLSHRIRALYEKAVASEHGAHCPLLWRMYLRFLVSEGNLERGSGILYKALQEIPWVKGLYMDAVQLFPDRVQEFLDLMTEKELRLRVPMEEVDILLED
ncbi:nuclear exosome regulator NRDE2 [Conger conger]|uniref:nuclear exosome regulator NRDE2 n=1 Tax=Conger conger TaxID=82655 RepID=UPI002A5A31AA|nr:nuclear exosome regulator NRDE2 [Conger conger]